jgi:hypothetical protein
VLVIVGVTCVGYGDFLKATLSRNMRFWPSFHIITSQDDLETQLIAAKAGASVYVSAAWSSPLGPFDKGAALNDWLDHVESAVGDGWVCLLDADIVLLSSFDIEKLDPTCLYGAPRRLCETITQWRDVQAGVCAVQALTLDVPPVVSGRVWGDKDTANPAALCGYCQIWNLRSARGLRRYPASGFADRYDVEFALSFGEEGRLWLPGTEVIHLGPLAANWQGRRTPRWGD